MTGLFGTDGVRGRANSEPITAETVLRLAMAAGALFRRGDHRHVVVIGKDTRLSGYMLEPALTAGFTAMGMDVVLLGPIPTPAVGMLTRSLRADLGVMISASHNPYCDNGIKLFGPDGFKLSDQLESKIERLMESGPDALSRATPEALGRARRMEDATGRYIEFAKATFPRGLRLDGLRIVVDCANGAAYKAAPRVFYELGAEVIAVADAPDGLNINDGCGATAPEKLSCTVRDRQADIGIALDGDADRVILVDERGQVADGDQMLALIARQLHARGALAGGGVVATLMANLGLERDLMARGLQLIRTPVGDRHVVQRMRLGGYNVGGESCGHMVFADYTTTGDGVIAALQVLAAIAEADRPASEMLAVFDPVPQRSTNVRVDEPARLLRFAPVRRALVAAEQALKAGGRGGRLVVRPSGTEPVVRIMAEGDDAGLLARVVDPLSAELHAAAAETETETEPADRRQVTA
ncbi:phosphoglucosamine mutase [Rhodovibrio salinarum]|uniref:Phosphoglucosamine mutase n=1 Tax=Rhodovibrio salinarum TaxID=1087 RepID=A0A934UZ54_9PROT|nr:phosphoglucosamine mutase [Rhodovibrio salinarum]MBK1696010.1 phosphoglucosamine mutase [Rhodovibrio salinarum]